jgi:histidyl-tRNA synthetase
MRGFDYYSGIVFEVFDVSPDNNRSLFGGGRYDGLVGLFGVDPVPTVGFGMGDVVLADFLETHGLIPRLLPETNLYAVVVDEPLLPRAEKVVTELRKEGVNVALDISGKSLDKQFKTANKKGIPYVLVIGKKELDEGQYILKNMQSGLEETHGVERIASIVKDARNLGLEAE